MPTAKLLGRFHCRTVTLHLTVNDAVSAIGPIVAVSQFPISILFVGKGGTMTLLATEARNSQSGTARLLLPFLYFIDSMFMLFVKTTAKHY